MKLRVTVYNGNRELVAHFTDIPNGVDLRTLKRLVGTWGKIWLYRMLDVAHAMDDEEKGGE